MAGDRAVFVGVGEVGVQRAGEVELGVVGQQPQDGLQVAAVGVRDRALGVGVDDVRGELRGDWFERGACCLQLGAGGVEAFSQLVERVVGFAVGRVVVMRLPIVRWSSATALSWLLRSARALLRSGFRAGESSETTSIW